jgi:protein SCO1
MNSPQNNLQGEPHAHDYEPKTNHSAVLWFCAILMLSGIALFWNYYAKHNITNQGATSDEINRPPYSGMLKHNLELTRDDGQKVNFGQLEGKVWIVAYIYTRCPRGCSAIAAQMKEYVDKYGSNPLFKAVAITLYPEEDTPEFLKVFRESRGLIGDDYWFLTGDGKTIRGYMQDEFKLIVTEIPPAEQLNPFDRWNHKLSIVLVDHQRRIRRTSDFGDASVVDIWKQQLDRDIAIVLKEAEQAAK